MQSVLITGGTSGLGLEMARSFRDAGYNVYTTGRDPKRLKEISAGIHFFKM
jgi:short-subunit dehydrogenase involved in D-alanine esterification of teichoic acids